MLQAYFLLSSADLLQWELEWEKHRPPNIKHITGILSQTLASPLEFSVSLQQTGGLYRSFRHTEATLLKPICTMSLNHFVAKQGCASGWFQCHGEGMDAVHGIPDFHSADGHSIFHMATTVTPEPHKSFISNWYVTAPYSVLVRYSKLSRQHRRNISISPCFNFI